MHVAFRTGLAAAMALAMAHGVSAASDPREEARAALARGDYRLRKVDGAAGEQARQDATAYNETILLGQPYITPENDLERSVVALARDPSPQNVAAFERALIEGPIYLVTTKEGRAAAAAGGKTMPIWMAPMPDGSTVAVLFTSERRVAEALHNSEDIHWVAVTGRGALEMVRGKPVMVNFGLQPPVSWPAEQTERLLSEAQPSSGAAEDPSRP